MRLSCFRKNNMKRILILLHTIFYCISVIAVPTKHSRKNIIPQEVLIAVNALKQQKFKETGSKREARLAYKRAYERAYRQYQKKSNHLLPLLSLYPLLFSFHDDNQNHEILQNEASDETSDEAVIIIPPRTLDQIFFNEILLPEYFESKIDNNIQHNIKYDYPPYVCWKENEEDFNKNNDMIHHMAFCWQHKEE